MFEGINAFYNDVLSYDITIPFFLKIAIIIIVITVLTIGMYYAKNEFEISYFSSAYTWYFVVALLNLISILVIVYFYYSKDGTYVGPKGKKGKRGSHGREGKSVTCTYDCNNNIYVQKTNNSDIICQLNSMIPSGYANTFVTINNNLNYFNTIINIDNINYTTLVSNVVLQKTGQSINDIEIKFKSLTESTALTLQLVNYINENIGTASFDLYATFKKPVTKNVGFIPLGDTVYGGTEDFNLNSFLVKGDIRYPTSFELLATLQSYNENTNDSDTYTVWRPNDKSEQQQIQIGVNQYTSNTVLYKSLGDIIIRGTTEPPLNSIGLIKETCLETISNFESTLVFAYIGNDNTFSDNKELDYTQNTSYLIKNKVPNNIVTFSMWRTPINTFITNNNQHNPLINDTVAYNIFNNLDEVLNNYGNIKTESRQALNIFLSILNLPKITIAAILCKHFNLNYKTELIYYINQAQTQVGKYYDYGINVMMATTPATTKPNQQYNKPSAKSYITSIPITNTATLGDMIQAIQDTINQYDEYNKYLLSQGSTNSADEKHLPDNLQKVYNKIYTSLQTLPVLIKNTNTMLEVINVIFNRGLDTRVAIDSEGLSEGGTMLNEVQELIIRLCKIMMPPNKNFYIIKDECLATTMIDKNREVLIIKLGESIGRHKKFIDLIKTYPDKYQPIQQSIYQYEQALNIEVGMIVGHIQNWNDKLNQMNLEEFTTTRIAQVIAIYELNNLLYTDIFNNIP